MSEGNEKSAMGSPTDLRTCTKAFALRIIKLFSSLPTKPEAQVLGKQLLRSGTSVGAHYRESVRARSNAEFISKLEGGLQELEETGYWLELLAESGMVSPARLGELLNETSELTAILVYLCQERKEARLMHFSSFILYPSSFPL
jgi:four helix bundle protein